MHNDHPAPHFYSPLCRAGCCHFFFTIPRRRDAVSGAVADRNVDADPRSYVNWFCTQHHYCNNRGCHYRPSSTIHRRTPILADSLRPYFLTRLAARLIGKIGGDQQMTAWFALLPALIFPLIVLRIIASIPDFVLKRVKL